MVVGFDFSFCIMISWVDRSGFCHFLSFIFVNYSLAGASVGRMGFEIKKAEISVLRI